MNRKNQMLHDIAMYDGALQKQIKGKTVYKLRKARSWLHVDQLPYAKSLDALMPIATRVCGQAISRGDHAIKVVHKAVMLPPDRNGEYTELLEAVHETLTTLRPEERIVPAAEPKPAPTARLAVEPEVEDFIQRKAAELEIRMRSETIRSLRECVAWMAERKRGTIGELTNPAPAIPDGPTEDEVRVKSIYGDAFLYSLKNGTCMVMADLHLRNECVPVSKVSRDGIEAWASAAHRLEVSGLLKTV